MNPISPYNLPWLLPLLRYELLYHQMRGIIPTKKILPSLNTPRKPWMLLFVAVTKQTQDRKALSIKSSLAAFGPKNFNSATLDIGWSTQNWQMVTSFKTVDEDPFSFSLISQETEHLTLLLSVALRNERRQLHLKKETMNLSLLGVPMIQDGLS